MIKSKNFVFFIAVIMMLLVAIGGWLTTPAQATGAKLIDATPTPTSTAIKDSDDQGIIPSVEEQEEIKNVVYAYFDTRYHALSVSDLEGFKKDGFGDLMSIEQEAQVFLSEELGKLAVEIRHAELNHLRYADYRYFLDFRSITVDATAQTATISASEENEVVYEASMEANPQDPIVSHQYNIIHTIVLRKEGGKWRIVSDEYNDNLWKTLRQDGKSIDEILDATSEMLRKVETSPILSIQNRSDSSAFASALSTDTSTHPYDRRCGICT
jgi:hypothetical protein